LFFLIIPPSVVLLYSVGDCEAFYQKLKNPNEVANKLVESETINQLADDFWKSNGQKYNWNFFANKVNYTEDNLVRQQSLTYKAKQFFESNHDRAGNLSKLGNIAMDELVNHDEIFAETLQLLSLPKDLLSYYLEPIITALIVDELFDCYLLNHLCIFCRPPIYAHDSQRRLHHSSGPAVEFPNGESYYYWKGREVPQKWIVNPEKLTKEDLLTTFNIEGRRILHEILGDERFANMLNLKVTEFNAYNDQAVYLMCTSSPDMITGEYLYFIKVFCNTTGRKYHICIPVEAFCLGAIGALAWTFGMEAREYQLLVET